MAVCFPCPGLGSAGPDLRAQGSSQEERLSRCARGMRWIASSACSGPVPLPPGLAEVANLPPITPRPSPPSREPWLPSGQDHGQGDGWTSIAFPKFGNRSLTPSPGQGTNPAPDSSSVRGPEGSNSFNVPWEAKEASWQKCSELQYCQTCGSEELTRRFCDAQPRRSGCSRSGCFWGPDRSVRVPCFGVALNPIDKSSILTTSPPGVGHIAIPPSSPRICDCRS